jgi:hypothetical protein
LWSFANWEYSEAYIDSLPKKSGWKSWNASLGRGKIESDCSEVSQRRSEFFRTLSVRTRSIKRICLDLF